MEVDFGDSVLFEVLKNVQEQGPFPCPLLYILPDASEPLCTHAKLIYLYKFIMLLSLLCYLICYGNSCTFALFCYVFQ